MLAATAMGLRLCGIFAQKQKPPADPHSFHTIPYSMKGLTTATLVSMHPLARVATRFARAKPVWALEPSRAAPPAGRLRRIKRALL